MKLASALVLLAALPPAAPAQRLAYRDLLDAMLDLEASRLPRGKVIQLSSYDRRSTTPSAAGWFANSDGFGREPRPGFLEQLREPASDGTGEWLVADVEAPGVVVRTWSAGMGGVLRVFLDDAPAPLFEGRADRFLRQRSRWLFDAHGIALDPAGTFEQEDADYLPIHFARRLRVTWEGKLAELHFYQLQVRVLAGQVFERGFDPARDLSECAAHLERVARGLRPVGNVGAERAEAAAATLAPGETWTWDLPGQGERALVELELCLEAADVAAARRGTLLRLLFDGASQPQVEAPCGDFFGVGPGAASCTSLPFDAGADWLRCRFPMPFERSARLSLWNTTRQVVRAVVIARQSARPFRTESWPNGRWLLARWRADHDLLADPARPCDLPVCVVLGRGTLVGVAAMLMNPSPVPTPGGNWWGEGDEKVFVDGERQPSIFGTGSEDFFNYAWSRPRLFAHPYCGQPLCTGPGTAGHVSNHRFLILDAVPFERSLAFYLELLHHERTPGLSYARIAWLYAEPGATSDHRALGPSDLVVPALPRREPVAKGGARGAVFHRLHDLSPTGVELVTRPEPLAPSLVVDGFTAKAGERLKLRLPLAEPGRWRLRLVAWHGADAGALRVLFDGQPLQLADDRSGDVAALREPRVRVQNLFYQEIEAEAGDHDLLLEAAEPGFVGADYLWLQRVEPPKPAAAKPKGDELLSQAVARLLALQEGDGQDQWPYEGVYREDRGQLPVGYRAGGTAIVCLALLAVPGLAEDAPRRAAIERGVEFVLGSLEHGRMQKGFVGTYDVRNWGHIYALQLFLELARHAELPADLRRRCADKVPWLVGTLGEMALPMGGWNYSHRGGYRSQQAVASPFMTGPALQALFAAQRAGHAVDERVIDAALDALERARTGPGGYAYGAPATAMADRDEDQLGMMDKTPGSAARAACVETTLLLAGRGDAARHTRAIERFFEHWDALAARRQQTGTHVRPYGIAPYYFLYGHWYCAQAIELVADEAKRAPLRARLREVLLATREPDGSWNDRQFPRSTGYGTALAILCLRMPALPKPAERVPAKR